MIANIIKYKKLTSEQLLYIRNHLSKSARALKRHTSKINKKQRVQFRASILSAWRDGSIDMEKLAYALERVSASEHAQFLADLEVVYIVKKPHAELDWKTIEDALITGFIPLFTSWCRGKQDRLSEFLVKVIDSIYLYTKPKLSLIEYLKRCHSTISTKFMTNESSIIRYPEKWNLLRMRFDENVCKNPTLNTDEVMESMSLTKGQKKKLKQQIQMTSTLNLEDHKSITCNKKEEMPILGINLDDVPLTDLQRRSVHAYMHGDWGWQTKLAAETLNQETGKPYTKMSVNNHFKAAIEAIKEYMDLRNE